VDYNGVVSLRVMSILTPFAVLALAGSCQHVVAPQVILNIAKVESGFDTAAIHVNKNGTIDRGIMQINNSNDQWLGLTDAFDPCQSIHAAANLLASYARYNAGSPTSPVGLSYAQRVMATPKPMATPSVSISTTTVVYLRPSSEGRRQLVFSTR
jgi:hypothetical protein